MRESEAWPLDFGSCESNRTGESAVSCVKLLSREIALVRFVFESRGENLRFGGRTSMNLSGRGCRNHDGSYYSIEKL